MKTSQFTNYNRTFNLDCRCGALGEGVYVKAIIDLRQDFNIISLAFFRRINDTESVSNQAHVRRLKYPSTKGEKYTTSRIAKVLISGANIRWQTEASLYVCKDLPYPLILGTDWLRSGGLIPTLNGNKLYLTHHIGPYLAEDAVQHDFNDPVIAEREEHFRLLVPFGERPRGLKNRSINVLAELARLKAKRLFSKESDTDTDGEKGGKAKKGIREIKW